MFRFKASVSGHCSKRVRGGGGGGVGDCEQILPQMQSLDGVAPCRRKKGPKGVGGTPGTIGLRRGAGREGSKGGGEQVFSVGEEDLVLGCLGC